MFWALAMQGGSHPKVSEISISPEKRCLVNTNLFAPSTRAPPWTRVLSASPPPRLLTGKTDPGEGDPLCDGGSVTPEMQSVWAQLDLRLRLGPRASPGPSEHVGLMWRRLRRAGSDVLMRMAGAGRWHLHRAGGQLPVWLLGEGEGGTLPPNQTRAGSTEARTRQTGRLDHAATFRPTFSVSLRKSFMRLLLPRRVTAAAEPGVCEGERGQGHTGHK